LDAAEGHEQIAVRCRWGRSNSVASSELQRSARGLAARRCRLFACGGARSSEEVRYDTLLRLLLVAANGVRMMSAAARRRSAPLEPYEINAII